LGQLAYAQGEYTTARGDAQEALHAFERAEDEAGMAQSLTTLANLRCDAEADYEGARPLYEQSLALYRQIGDRYGQAKGIINLGALAHSLGQYERARSYYEEGIALCRQLGHRQPLAIALNNLGQVVDHLGQPAEASAILAESVALRREIGDLRGLVLTLISLGNVAARQDQRRQAKQHYAEATRIALQLGSAAVLADLLIGLADLLARWGEVTQAAKLATIVAEDAEGEEVRQKALSLLERLDAQDRKASTTGRSQAHGPGTLTAVDEMLRWLLR
jgi:tetratricopeptide (TPR) repeat protein